MPDRFKLKYLQVRAGNGLIPPNIVVIMDVNGEENSLGMNLSSSNLDFDDGELKTNKCDAAGNPRETVFIAQISSVIDELIQERPFEQTHLYEKISNILYVTVCKDGYPKNWMFLPSIHIDLDSPRFSKLRNIWRNDYNSICRQLKRYIETSPDGFIHTSNCQHILVRSKDSKPYHPIYSSTYGRYVSDKNHAFYFQKQFVSSFMTFDHEPIKVKVIKKIIVYMLAIR